MRPAILLCDDIFFSSKVESAGRMVGRDITVVGALAPLLSAIEDEAADSETRLIVIVDLENRTVELPAVKEAVSTFAPEPHLIAYAGHKRTDLLQGAAEQGCQTVLTRGQFDEQLATLLAED